MDLTVMNGLRLKLAADSTGNDTVAGSLYHARVGLYQAQMTLNENMVKATIDSNSATFSGYGADTVTWGSPTIADDGAIEVLGTCPAWMPSDTVTTNNIWGLYAWCSDNTLAFAGQFDSAPLAMEGPLDQITVTLRYRPDAEVPVVVIS